MSNFNIAVPDAPVLQHVPAGRASKHGFQSKVKSFHRIYTGVLRGQCSGEVLCRAVSSCSEQTGDVQTSQFYRHFVLKVMSCALPVCHRPLLQGRNFTEQELQ